MSCDDDDPHFWQVVTHTLGQGGMAEVYLAYDSALDRQVAIKVIPPHLAAEEGFIARFLREARLVGIPATSQHRATL